MLGWFKDMWHVQDTTDRSEWWYDTTRPAGDGYRWRYADATDKAADERWYEELMGFRLDVTTDGPTVTIKCDPKTAARLAGREVFGPIAPVQAKLKDRIADAWYAAKCPSE